MIVQSDSLHICQAPARRNKFHAFIVLGRGKETTLTGGSIWFDASPDPSTKPRFSMMIRIDLPPVEYLTEGTYFLVQFDGDIPRFYNEIRRVVGKRYTGPVYIPSKLGEYIVGVITRWADSTAGLE